MVSMQNQGSMHVEEVLTGRDIEYYGIDPNAPVPEVERAEGVFVPTTAQAIPDNELDVAREIINQVGTQEDLGISAYRNVRQYVRTLLYENAPVRN